MTTQRQKRFESSKERKHGTKLIITKTDGQQIRGELITVKPKSLLLLDTEGKDVSVGIKDVRVIKIVKRPKFKTGARLGGLIGWVGGVLYAAISYEEPHEGAGIALGILYGLVLGIIGGGTGALIGGIVGAAVITDETIQIEGMTDIEIKETMDKLRKKARIRDYR